MPGGAATTARNAPARADLRSATSPSFAAFNSFAVNAVQSDGACANINAMSATTIESSSSNRDPDVNRPRRSTWHCRPPLEVRRVAVGRDVAAIQNVAGRGEDSRGTSGDTDAAADAEIEALVARQTIGIDRPP